MDAQQRLPTSPIWSINKIRTLRPGESQVDYKGNFLGDIALSEKQAPNYSRDLANLKNEIDWQVDHGRVDLEMRTIQMKTMVVGRMISFGYIEYKVRRRPS